MEGRTRARYPEEFRARAVRLAREQGATLKGVARDLGVPYESLRKWVRRAELDALEKQGVTPKVTQFVGGEGTRARPVDLLQAARWRWKLVLSTTLFVSLAVALYVGSLPSQYDGTAVVTITARPDAPFPGADYVSLAGPRYVAYITAPRTSERVARTIGEDARTLANSVTVSAAPNTSNITITARLPSPHRAAEAANALANAMVEYSNEDFLLVASIIAPAVPQAEPAFPPRLVGQAAGTLAGLLLGLVAAFALERHRPGIHGQNDVEALTTHPFLGALPRSRRLGGFGKAEPEPAAAPSSRGIREQGILRGLRRLPLDEVPTAMPSVQRLGVSFRRAVGNPTGVFVVTSSISGEGTSTIARALSGALASSKGQVLLIETGTPRPDPTGASDEGPPVSLSRLLRNPGTMAAAEEADRTDGKVVTLRAQEDRETSDLIVDRFPQFAREARDRFGLVIIGVPPVLESRAGPMMARLADGVVFVVSAGVPVASVDEAMALLEGSETHIVGVVGNRM